MILILNLPDKGALFSILFYKLLNLFILNGDKFYLTLKFIIFDMGIIKHYKILSRINLTHSKVFQQ